MLGRRKRNTRKAWAGLRASMSGRTLLGRPFRDRHLCAGLAAAARQSLVVVAAVGLFAGAAVPNITLADRCCRKLHRYISSPTIGHP